MWEGKFIGGTFGASYEGFKHQLDIDVRDLLPLKIVENDDTDLQLLWLHALEEHGINLTSEQMVAEWREHVHAPWSEYGIAMANWERGIMPPESGRVDNWYFGDGMGCPIRSEIWGIICPGMPALAAEYARRDAELDHCNNSVEAEIFLAALQAATFVEKDLRRLIDIGMEFVDPASDFARLVPQVIAWAEQHSWPEVRSLILRDYGHPDFTNSPQNMGFLLLSLIAGRGDFIETMNIAINCGYDTDCTAATAGAILNAIAGSAALPPEMRDGLTDEYKISDWMLGFPEGGSLTDLTHASCAFGLKVVAQAKAAGTPTPEITGAEAAVAVPPLAVTPRELKTIDPVAKPFPDWLVLGPYSRDWKEIAPQKIDFPDHGNAALPSCKYMTQMHSGFDTEFADAARLSAEGVDEATLASPFARRIVADDSRILLEPLNDVASPATYYACASFDSPDASLNWLLAGSTGPIELWLNGERVIAADTYQPLNPCTWDPQVTLREGRNYIVLKLEKTSQPAAAFVQFKRHHGDHWHQCFLNTSLNWVAIPEHEPIAAAR
jgi:ADP-ribosylglycohydrolase